MPLFIPFSGSIVFLYYFYHLIKYLLCIVHLCHWNVSSVVWFSTESPMPGREPDTSR